MAHNTQLNSLIPLLIAFHLWSSRFPDKTSVKVRILKLRLDLIPHTHMESGKASYLITETAISELLKVGRNYKYTTP